MMVSTNQTSRRLKALNEPYMIHYYQMDSNQGQEADSAEFDIEHLEEDLGVFEVRLDQKLKELSKNFQASGYVLDVNKSYYDHFSNSDAKFKDIMNDLTQFLIKDELASTPTLRSTFYKVIDSPLFCLFKSSKFELFELCLNGFDIEYQPDEAIKEVHKTLCKRTQDMKKLLSNGFQPDMTQLGHKVFSSVDALLFYSCLKSIQFKLFTLYSYIRKGASFLKKEYEHRLYLAEMFASLQKELIPILVKLELTEPLKQLATLNFQIFTVQQTYDFFFFYFSIPPTKAFLDVYATISFVAERCEKNNNYNPFVVFVLKHHKELNSFVGKTSIDEQYIPFINSLLLGGVRLLRAQVGLYEEFVSVLETLLLLSRTHYSILECFLTYKPTNQRDQLVAIRDNFHEEVLSKNLAFLYTLRPLSFEQVRQRLEKAQQKYLFCLNFADVDQTRLKSMLELIGDVPQRFFNYVQPQLKVWNPTVSISGKHRYIQSQFNKIQDIQSPIVQNLQMVNNFLYLRDVYPKQYESLFESKLNSVYFLDLLDYLVKNPSTHKTLGNQLQFYALSVLGLYTSIKDQKDLFKPEDRVKYLNVFAKASSAIHTPNNQTIYVADLVRQIESLKYQLTTRQYISLLTTLAVAVQRSSEKCFKTILTAFSDLDVSNAKLKANRFHEQYLDSVSSSHVSKQQANILKQKYETVDGKLVCKDLSVFKFTTQDVSTNPLNFQSRIDDIFISLTANSKRVVQVIILETVDEVKQMLSQDKTTTSKLEFMLMIVKHLCKEYPILVPYIVSLKVSTLPIKEAIKNPELKSVIGDNTTFGELLCQLQLICDTNQVVSELIASLLNERSIKYLNGKDFIKQEVAPTISEALIKLINAQRASKSLKDKLPRMMSLLVMTLEIQGRASREQVDIIKGALGVLRQQISECKSADQLMELSTVYRNCIRLFFRYKGNELNKPLLESTYPRYSHLEIQNYDIKNKSEHQIEKVDKLKNQSLLNFTVNLDFDIENSKLMKSEVKPVPPTLYDIPAGSILNDLKPAVVAVQKSSTQWTQEKQTVVNMEGCKYNLLYHLGEAKLSTICSRTESRLKLSAAKTYPDKHLNNQQEELKNIVAFYSKEVFVPVVQDDVLEGAVVKLLQGHEEVEFLRNPVNFQKVCGILTLLLVRDYSTTALPDNQVTRYLKGAKIDCDSAQYQAMVTRILDIFSLIGYSNFWVYSFKQLQSKQLKATKQILQGLPQSITNQSLLAVILTFTLESYVANKFTTFSHFSGFIRSFFQNRAAENQIITYKVTVDKKLLNLILKCIDFEHLNYVSILFYSNFENLRMYTDDLQEGFKALNLASKTRAYNEFLRLSNQYNDVEYLNPLKIFKQNLKFFVKIEKEGYLFKVEQEAAITVQRIINQLKSGTYSPEQTDAVMDQYFVEVDKLKVNTINRVKSIYLTAKLRDLSIQNGTTIALFYEVLKKLGTSQTEIIEEISKVELFSIICNIHYDLLSFEDSYCNMTKYANYDYIDLKSIRQDIVLSTTRRFGFNMNKHLNQLEFQFDEVIQSALANAKPFLVSAIGSHWLQGITINPALPTFNRIRMQNSRKSLLNNIQLLLTSNHEKPIQVTIRQNLLCEDLVKQLSKLPTENFLKKDGLVILMGTSKYTLDSLAPKVIGQAITKQILLKQDHIYTLNRNKFSEDSLDVLEALGLIIAYCVFWKIKLDIPLHHSIICQICSTMVDLDDLLTVDFKTWEYLKMVLSQADSKTLNLNFSYQFDSLTDHGKKQKIELIDKGIQKKVNNLNREEYCDYICCRILFGNVKLQLERLLTGVFKVLPKQYICNLQFDSVLQTFYKTDNKDLLKKLQFQNLKKFGIILPETYATKDLTFQNLKDFVNINWLVDSLQELPTQKFAKFAELLGCKELEFLNLNIYTRTGANQSLELLPQQTVIVNHFKTKQAMKAALNSKV